MRKLWITGCIVMICMGMLTACGGNKTEVVPIGDTEEADREVPYAMYINRVEGGKASVTISNYTDEEILYGTDFHLQKYIGSDWVDVSFPIISLTRGSIPFRRTAAWSRMSNGSGCTAR